MNINPRDINLRAVRALIEIAIGISVATVTTISAWIMGIRERRRIKRALGADASDADLVSLNTWLQVEDAEKKQGLTDSGNR